MKDRTRTRQFETKITCTGGRKAPHPSRQLAQVTYTAYRHADGAEDAQLYMQDGPTDTDAYWKNGEAGIERAAQFRGLFDGGMWFRCPTCRREERLPAERLGAAMCAWDDAGQDTLDVSKIR